MPIYDFLNKASHAGRLDQEIRAADATLASLLDGVTANSGISSVSTHVLVTQTLTTPQFNTLSGIVVAHIPYGIPEEVTNLVNTINGVSGQITLNVNENAEITAQQLDVDTGEINITTGIPSASGALITQATVLAGSFYNAEQSSSSSSNSTNFQRKLRLTTPNLEAGQYRIGWSFEWAGSRVDKNGQEFRVQIDDNTTILSMNPLMNNKANGYFFQDSGFKYVDLNTGIHNIDLDYKAVSTNSNHHGGGSSSQNTVTIREARLEIWRVS